MAELYNLAAEIGILGALLDNNKSFDHTGSILKPEDFYMPAHVALYTEMSRRIRSGGVADGVTLRDWVLKEPLFEEQGLQYLITLLDSAAFGPELKDYTTIVKEYSTRRHTLVVLNATASQLEGSEAPSEVIDGLEHSLREIQTSSTDKWRWQGSDGITDSILRPWDISDCVPTGIKALDDKIIGLPRRKPTVIAGRPGMGKSLLGASIAWRAAMNDVGVGIFSLEMDASELWQRMVCDMAFEHAAYDGHRDEFDTPIYQDILKGTASREHLNLVRRAMDDLRGLPIQIDDTQGLRPSDMHRWARRLARMYERKGKQLGVIIVDHLHRVRPEKNYTGNKTAEFTDISMTMAEIAKELNVALVELCQLNRSVENRVDKHPMMADLRESGAIEQDAQLVMGLCRPWYYAERKFKDGETLTEEEEKSLATDKWKMDIDILKQRSGPLDRIQVKCHAGANAIRDFEPPKRFDRRAA